MTLLHLDCNHSSTCDDGYFCRFKTSSEDLCWPCPGNDEKCAKKFASTPEIEECEAICEGKLQLIIQTPSFIMSKFGCYIFVDTNFSIITI